MPEPVPEPVSEPASVVVEEVSTTQPIVAEKSPEKSPAKTVEFAIPPSEETTVVELTEGQKRLQRLKEEEANYNVWRTSYQQSFTKNN